MKSVFETLLDIRITHGILKLPISTMSYSILFIIFTVGSRYPKSFKHATTLEDR